MALAINAFAQEETSVLPHGIFRTWVIGAVGGSEFQFNSAGKREGLAHILNRSVPIKTLEEILAKSVDPSTQQLARKLGDLRSELNQFGEIRGQSGLGDNLYQAELFTDARVEATQLVYALEYGLTPKVSLGLALPLQWYDIKARFRVENQHSFGNTRALLHNMTPTDGIDLFEEKVKNQSIFEEAIFTKNGYKVPSNSQIFGMGDMEGGIKYRAFESTYVDSAFLFGFRLPTASHKKDHRNLVDKSTGDGQYDLAIQGGFDFKFTPNLVMLSALKYTYQFADSENVVGKLKGSEDPLPNLNDPRVYDTATRKLGNMFDLNLNLRYYMFQRRFAIIGAYIFQHKYADSYKGSNPDLNYAELERNTRTRSHAAELFLVYSTVADYMRKEKAIPWEASVTYHHTLAGTNTPDVHYAYGRLKFFFN